MRRIDEVNNRKMKNVKRVEVVDKKRIKVVFNNNDEITLVAQCEDYGSDSGMYIEKDNV